ncbi:MAG: Crp/Fnr family transcriptional regulator [Ilumatobacteraceae bacterium]
MSEHDFLDQLDADHVERLVQLGRRRTHPPQSILFFEGDVPHDVILVRRGDLKVSTVVDGREVVLDVLGPGAIVGEVSAVDGRTRSATVTALTTTEIVAIPAATFMDFLGQHPVIALTLLRCMATRIRDASRRQVEYGALDAVGRVCRRLVELMDRYGHPVPGEATSAVRIDAPLTQGDIAAWAGLSREAVVKALHALRRLGWVATSSRAITVLDVDAVVARAAVT